MALAVGDKVLVAGILDADYGDGVWHVKINLGAGPDIFITGVVQSQGGSTVLTDPQVTSTTPVGSGADFSAYDSSDSETPHEPVIIIVD